MESERQSALAQIMSDLITNESIASISQTMPSKLEESSVVGPPTQIEPTNRFLFVVYRWHWCSQDSNAASELDY